MPNLVYTHEFVEGGEVDAEQIMANFTSIQTLLDAGLDEDNFNYLRESKVIFSTHAHGGGTDGSVINADSLTGITPTLAVHEGADGAMYVETGLVRIANGTVSDTITLNRISNMTAMPLVFVNNSISGFGYNYDIRNITANTFKIANVSAGSTYDFYYRCMGI